MSAYYEVQFQVTCRCSRTCSPFFIYFNDRLAPAKIRVSPTGISTGTSAEQFKFSISVSPSASEKQTLYRFDLNSPCSSTGKWKDVNLQRQRNAANGLAAANRLAGGKLTIRRSFGNDLLWAPRTQRLCA